MSRKFKWKSLAVASLVALVAIGATRYSDVYFLIKKNFTIFSEVYREVSLRYVDEVNPEKLMRKGIDAMLESLDPYTVLIDEADTQEIDIITTGKYGGVGIEAGSRGGKIVVIAPIEGYSAFKKGVKAGDVIMKVNDISVEGLTPEDVQNLIHGEPGTTVTVTIQRYGVEQPLHFELERQNIEVKNVEYAGLIGPNKDVGYILLSRFSQNTGEEVRNAILKFKQHGALNGIILDLRNNPGGLLDEAVKTVDKFVGPGIKVVETRGRIEENNSVFRTEEPALAGNIPLVVLQNSGSASASEVVAGALQDLDRAVIVGEQSFGKGLVQIIRPLSYNTALKITTSKYYIPSGRSIQSVTYTHDENNSHFDKPDSLRKAFKTRAGRTVYDGQGIQPDVKVTQNDQSLLQIALLQNSYYFFFANQYASEHKQLPGHVTDGMYTEFRDYLKAKKFDYETRTEKDLQALKKRFASNGQLEKGADYISGLQRIIEQEKEQEFADEASEIKRELYRELASRYYGRTGQIRAATRFDPYIGQGLDIIANTTRYDDILSVR